MKTYSHEPSAPTPVRVGISELVVQNGDESLTSYGLGSCVAIALYDSNAQVGGLAHTMLPDGDEKPAAESTPGKFANTAIRELLRRMVEAGATYTAVEAKIAGGSDMFGFSNGDDSIGQRNVDAAIAELDRLGVPLVGEDTGGSHGRTVEFEPATGAFEVRTADPDHGVKRL